MKLKAFTLAELLIALAILGVIATFTIPKVLTAQQNTAWTSAAKEAASIVSGAYQAYKIDHAPEQYFSLDLLVPYINYVQRETVGAIDSAPQFASSLDCSDTAAYYCLRLHNGGILAFDNNRWFDGTDPTGDAIHAFFDPDGGYSVPTTGTGDSVVIVLQYNGRVSMWGESVAGCSNAECYNPAPANIPSWFS